MLVSELIEKLNKIIDKEGDLVCVTRSWKDRDRDNISDVNVITGYLKKYKDISPYTIENYNDTFFLSESIELVEID